MSKKETNDFKSNFNEVISDKNVDKDEVMKLSKKLDKDFDKLTIVDINNKIDLLSNLSWDWVKELNKILIDKLLLNLDDKLNKLLRQTPKTLNSIRAKIRNLECKNEIYKELNSKWINLIGNNLIFIYQYENSSINEFKNFISSLNIEKAKNILELYDWVSFSFSKPLEKDWKKMDSKYYVSSLQFCLNELNGDKLKIDWKFWLNTKKALLKWQNENKWNYLTNWGFPDWQFWPITTKSFLNEIEKVEPVQTKVEPEKEILDKNALKEEIKNLPNKNIKELFENNQNDNIKNLVSKISNWDNSKKVDIDNLNKIKNSLQENPLTEADILDIILIETESKYTFYWLQEKFKNYIPSIDELEYIYNSAYTPKNLKNYFWADFSSTKNNDETKVIWFWSGEIFDFSKWNRYFALIVR